MKLLIDMVNKDFFISLISNNKTIIFKHIKNHVKKSELLPIMYKEIIEESGIKTTDIKSIYVVNGPGSFMGIRAGMVFGKTISFLTKASFFSTNNLKYISQGMNGTFYVDARSDCSYRGVFDNGLSSIEIVPHQEDSIIDYTNIINNPSTILNLFTKVSDVESFKCEYFKEPQVGAG